MAILSTITAKKKRLQETELYLLVSVHPPSLSLSTPVSIFTPNEPSMAQTITIREIGRLIIAALMR